jgi:hypothetical protein
MFSVCSICANAAYGNSKQKIVPFEWSPRTCSPKMPPFRISTPSSSSHSESFAPAVTTSSSGAPMSAGGLRPPPGTRATGRSGSVWSSVGRLLKIDVRSSPFLAGEASTSPHHSVARPQPVRRLLPERATPAKTQPRLRVGVVSRDCGSASFCNGGRHFETRLKKVGNCETLASRNYRHWLPIFKSSRPAARYVVVFSAGEALAGNRKQNSWVIAGLVRVISTRMA